MGNISHHKSAYFICQLPDALIIPLPAVGRSGGTREESRGMVTGGTGGCKGGKRAVQVVFTSEAGQETTAKSSASC